MNDVELRALKLMRLAWSVLDGQASEHLAVQELNRLERLSPDVFEQVVLQLERDSGRWSKVSQLPKVEVNRNASGMVESIVFTSIPDASPANHVKPSFIWVSDHADKSWLEAFAQELMSQVRPEDKTKPDPSKDER
jgi:hypothetical protein